ncbi:fibrillin-1 [Plakobranchus ocellatus]|uniref:protein disulfide-isomerase n=1 Tax=Plakobranchus ocellatus TaxID=259542 RepID=A0AAV4A0J5_9GAST|nr:fibrillin-1 [Plakobranchus ocellatus]
MNTLTRYPMLTSILASLVILCVAATVAAPSNMEDFEAETTENEDFARNDQTFDSDFNLEMFGPVRNPSRSLARGHSEHYLAGTGPKEAFQKLPSSSVNLSEKTLRHLEAPESHPQLSSPHQWEVFGEEGKKEQKSLETTGEESKSSVQYEEEFLPEIPESSHRAEEPTEPEESLGRKWGLTNWVKDAENFFASILSARDEAEKKAVEEGDMMDELFVAEEVFPEEYQESDGPILRRSRRAAIFSSMDFVNFKLTMIGSLSEVQRTSGSDANTALRAEIANRLKEYLDAQLPGYDFTTDVSDTVDITTGLEVTGEISFGVTDITLTCRQIGLSLLRLSWGTGLSVFGIQLNVIFPELGYQTRPLQAAVCYLCQSYETCMAMANQTWFCGFQDNRFYPFGTAQGDLSMNKVRGQTSARLAVRGDFPYRSNNEDLMFSTVWLSLYGTISIGRQKFDSFAAQDLPVPGANVIAVYWSHWVHSPLGEVYYQLYTKRGDNTPEEQAVLDRANSDVDAYAFKTFDASKVIVVTWDRVLSFHATSDTERASFQAAIITDGSETFLTFIYGEGALQVTTQDGNPISVGWGEGINAVLDSQPNYFMYDRISGNTGKLGQWFFKIGELDNPAGKCFKWFNENVFDLPNIIQNNGNSATRGCPCNRRIARRLPNWIQVVGEPTCFDVLPPPGIIWGRRCCYRGNNLNNVIPGAGSYQSYSPFSGDIEAHLVNDIRPKTWCCDQSDNCNLYYTLRPTSRCRRRLATASFCWGDPHMVTVDGKTFTFNNLGEFTFLNVKGMTPENVTVDIVTQARTCRIEAMNGTMSRATIWCAFALESGSGSRVQVSMQSDNGGEPYMVIFANNRDYSANFANDANFLETNQDIFLSKDSNNALQIGTRDGVSFTVSLQMGVMEFAVEIEPQYRNLVSGLMGNFNTDPADDFIYPNGTEITRDLTDREIFEYVQTWAVTDATTVFTYVNGLGTANFSDPNFIPLFLDEVSDELLALARDVCSGNQSECIFDFVATNNTQLAQRTKAAMETFDADVKESENSAPVISGPTVLNVIDGSPSSATFNITDADNDNLTVTLEQIASSTIREIQTGVFEIVYTPQANTSLIEYPTLVATDQNNLVTITPVEIVQCSGCNNRGNCSFTERRQVSDYVSLAVCICEAAYSGDDCENDSDGCASNPCPLRSNCTDVPADEELTTGVAFRCGPCPDGFQNVTGDCVDVNECLDNTTCPSNAVCTNTIGGFSCACIDGYRLDDSGVCQDVDECIELRHECEQTCFNTPGSYVCGCLPGFTLDEMGFNCTEISDPCASLNASCEYGCQVVDGSAACFCARGFRLGSDGLTCENVNECDTNLCAQECTDTVGSYICSCLPGFILADDKHECDRCALNRYGKDCAFQCECRGRAIECDNVLGCRCHDGWTGQSCELDIDECSSQTPNLCPADRLCRNTNGSYVCDCPVGYQAASSTDNCTDIDECANQLDHMCPQMCVNNPGSFACQCQSGYTYNRINNTCDDFDECTGSTSQCQQECVNVPGSYNCQCRSGYTLEPDRKTCRLIALDPCGGSNPGCSFGCTVENGAPVCFCPIGAALTSNETSCEPVNECLGANECSDECTDTADSYTCSCPAGKELANDGRTCVVCDDFHWGDNCANQCDCNPVGTTTCNPVSGCVCKEGWNGTKCENNIDECGTNPCPAFSTCVNTPGSFICSCQDGLQLDANNTCTDIDECESSPCHQTCTNNMGGFVCSCSEGFRLVSNTDCEDINECDSPETNVCEQQCRNLIGGFQCGCRAGYVIDMVNRRNCSDIDECIDAGDNTCTIYQLCSNIPGSFTCDCKPGYTSGGGDICNEPTGNSADLLSLSVSLNLPDASRQILDSTTTEFRQMEQKVSALFLQQGKTAIGDTLLSVVVVRFTEGSFIADTRLAIAEAPGSEALATAASRVSIALSTTDVTSISPQASVLGITVGGVSVNETTDSCSVFSSLYNCSAGFQCNETNVACSPIPDVPQTTPDVPQTTTPDIPQTTTQEEDDNDRALVIGLSVGIPVFILIALVIGVLVYVYSRKKKSTSRDDSSHDSGQRSFESGIAPKWSASPRLPYGPVSYHDSESSRSGSTTSGRPGRSRPGPSRKKSRDDQFEPPWLAKGEGASAFGSPREEVEVPRDRPAGGPNTNSNFSWEYMFRLLEPHVPLEIQRPQVYPPQAPEEGSGGNSSNNLSVTSQLHEFEGVTLTLLCMYIVKLGLCPFEVKVRKHQ